MDIARIIRAGPDDTLCRIAVASGFRDCLKLRDANPPLKDRPLEPGDEVKIPAVTQKSDNGATELRHRFRRPGSPVASIRFVHGSQNLPFSGDPSLTELNISNYVTDLAGPDGTGQGATAAAARVQFPGPAQFNFDANANEDVDAFKVEVRDPRNRDAQLKVDVEAMRPTYNAAGRLNGHTTFPGTIGDAGTERGRRSLSQIDAGKMAATDRFRTGYLRLVVDSVDKATPGHDQQALLVTDMVDAGDPQVEILDQDVRAAYVIPTCRAAPAARCRVTKQVRVNRGQTVDLVVRICRAAPSGVVERTLGGPGDNGIIPQRDIKRRIETFVRRCWAQSHVRYHVARLETVDLPSDMLTVGDATGNVSRGRRGGAGTPAGQIGFTLNVARFGGGANSNHVVAPFNVPAGNKPEDTAKLIARAINALPNLQARVSLNSPEFGVPDDSPSADVLVSETGGGHVTITNLTAAANQDGDQKVQAISTTMTVQFRNGGDNYHVGGPAQRNLAKTYNTSDRAIDIEVIDVLLDMGGNPGTRGFTVPELAHLNADRQPRANEGVRNSIIMVKESTEDPNNPTVNPPSNNPFSLPHEIGHIMTDNGLHSRDNTQLMRSGTDGTSSSIRDSKRLIERLPPANNWEMSGQNADGSVDNTLRVRVNAVDRINTVSGDLMHA